MFAREKPTVGRVQDQRFLNRGSAASLNSGAKRNQDTSDIVAKKALLEEMISQARYVRESPKVILVGGQKVYLLSEGPLAAVGARNGQLGWFSGPKADAPNVFHPLQTCHHTELVQSCLPDQKSLSARKGGAAVTTDNFIRYRPGSEATAQQGNNQSVPHGLGPTATRLLTHFSIALGATGLSLNWTIGVAFMAGVVLYEVLQTETVKKLFEGPGKKYAPLMMGPQQAALFSTLATYGLLSMFIPAQVAAIPEYARGAFILFSAAALSGALVFGSHGSRS